MRDLNQKIAAVQNWINELQSNHSVDGEKSASIEMLLNEILGLIRPDTLQAASAEPVTETPLALARRIQAQTAVLTEANSVLKSQIAEHEIAEVTLRTAHNKLEVQLQEHIGDLSRLNQLLQGQIKENKRTQVLEQEERALTDALRDTLATMSNTLDLGKVLDHILDNVGRVTPYDGANVLLVESDLVHVVRQRGYVEKGQEKEWLNQRIPITKLAILQQLLDIGKPLAIPDTSASPMWIGFPDMEWVSSNVIAPIRANGKILGFLSLDSATPGYFTQAHAERLQSFADQAAIAIQNARLLDRAKRTAVMAERNRIANELHDTISQTLWSVILITERLPVLWEIDKEKGQLSLLTVHDLAQNALEEMRALLVELRPSALTDEKLGDLIRQVATIIANRAGLQIAVRVDEQEPVPSEVHFVLYRVVQEALNNIARHALASKVEIYFNSDASQIELTIQDDGMGFDPTDVSTNHLGLSIMKDRVEKIGGTIETISQKGAGTLIKVNWIAPADEDYDTMTSHE
jgi:signal transduction histidine kinase